MLFKQVTVFEKKFSVGSLQSLEKFAVGGRQFTSIGGFD